MGMVKIAKLVLVVIVIVVIASGVNGDERCDGDINGLVEECGRYVMRMMPKTSPSGGCCQIVKKIDEGCACSHVNRQIETLIDMSKAVFVAAFCGRPLLTGTKCGSYVVPPGA